MDYTSLRNKATAKINSKGVILYFTTYDTLPAVSLTSDDSLYLRLRSTATIKINTYGASLSWISNPEVNQDLDLVTYVYSGNDLLIDESGNIMLAE